MADGATKSGSSALLIFLATAVGSTFEQYDFLLYGMCSALFFNKLFFPSFSPAAGGLAAISVYGVGYCARPLGGIIGAQQPFQAIGFLHELDLLSSVVVRASAH